MGERGNIQINGVNFYTHWSGYRIKEIVANALDRGRSRWDDEEYLARIIFCELLVDRYITDEGGEESDGFIIDQDSLMEEVLNTTNFGISAGAESDMDYDTVSVRNADKVVEVSGSQYGFEEFITRYGEGKH